MKKIGLTGKDDASAYQSGLRKSVLIIKMT